MDLGVKILYLKKEIQKFKRIDQFSYLFRFETITIQDDFREFVQTFFLHTDSFYITGWSSGAGGQDSDVS